MRNPEEFSWLRAVKCAVSAAVYVRDVVCDAFTRLIGKKPAGKCVILYYHSVPRQQRRRFAQQMDVLMRHADVISLHDEVYVPAGGRCAAVTIDDAFENLLQNAIPELRRRGIPATIFAISGAMGKTFGDEGAVERVMTVEQLRSLPEDLITIGSHTVTHPFMPALCKEAARRELQESRAQLREMLQRDIRLFSFPFGGVTKDLLRLCREAGYHRVFTTLPGFAFGGNHQFAVGRVRVDPTDWPIEFYLKLAGAYRWLPWAFRLKRRLLRGGVAKHFSSKRRSAREMRVPKAVIQ